MNYINISDNDEEIFPFDENIEKDSNIFINCANCCQIFSSKDLRAHTCQFDDVEDFLFFSKNTNVVNAESEDYAQRSIINEKVCLEQLYDINKMYKLYLKEKINYDIPSDEDKISEYLGVITSASEIFQRSLEKKIDNICNICGRKFVHASGLKKHLFKHIQNNTTKDNSDEAGYNPIEVIVKCKLCGRLFTKTNQCYEHILSHHYDWSIKKYEDLADISDSDNEKVQVS